MSTGRTTGYAARNFYHVKPTVYLKADTTYAGGDGSVNNPYLLG